jgi:hypothetical protein
MFGSSNNRDGDSVDFLIVGGWTATHPNPKEHSDA